MRVAFQPIVDLISGEIIAYESLLRPGTNVSPIEAFEQARKNDTVVQLDKIAREMAFAAMGKLLKKDQKLFVNTEPESLKVLDQWKPWPYGINSDRIVIEITERVSNRDVYPVLNYFNQIGVSLAIDDFGTANSNLWLFDKIKPSYIKVDAQFISTYKDDGALAGMVSFCQRVGVMLIVEGVEKESDLNFLKHLSVRYAQGYYLGRPKYVESIETVSAADGK